MMLHIPAAGVAVATPEGLMLLRPRVKKGRRAGLVVQPLHGKRYRQLRTWAYRGLHDYRKMLMTEPCSYCNGPSGSIDHIQAVSKGGSPWWDNQTPACKKCNGTKGNRPLLEWMVWRNKRIVKKAEALAGDPRPAEEG